MSIGFIGTGLIGVDLGDVLPAPTPSAELGMSIGPFDELRRNKLNRENLLVEVDGLLCVGGEGDGSGDCEPGEWSIIGCCCCRSVVVVKSEYVVSKVVEVGKTGGGNPEISCSDTGSSNSSYRLDS